MALLAPQRIKFLLIVMEIHGGGGLTAASIGTIVGMPPEGATRELELLAAKSIAYPTRSLLDKNAVYWRISKEWCEKNQSQFYITKE